MKRKITAIFMALLIISTDVSAFCGFYVAKASTDLFNEKSEVILVRDGDRTVITMSNDFKGEVKDFAMVVPVPVVLREDQIKVVEREIFDRLDAYSAPRLVEYHDANPCEPMVVYDSEMAKRSNAPMSMMIGEESVEEDAADYGVTIEAE